MRELEMDLGANLPPEAFAPHMEPLVVNESWIRNAERDDQMEAMRAWWYARYEDPSQSTPYNGREGGFLFVGGGPFNPADELHAEFSSVVDEEVIDELVEELHTEIGDAWAPIRMAPDYDDQFDVEPQERNEPVAHLVWALEADSDRLMTLAAERPIDAEVLTRHAIISVVGAMETYLWETAKYWVEAEASVLRNVVSKSNKLKDRPLKLGQIFERHQLVTEEVTEYFRSLVWHRLDEVKPLLECAFEVKLPSVKPLLQSMVLRHDLVHRNGRSVDGRRIDLTREHFFWLKRQVLEFSIALESSIVAKWPDEAAEIGLRSMRSSLTRMGDSGQIDPATIQPAF